jgi:hypothetical protein
MNEATRLMLTLAGLAVAYLVMAIVQLPNDSRFDPDEFIGRVAVATASSTP